MDLLSLENASLIVDKCIEKGKEMGFAPLTVAVLEASGTLKVLKREDGSSLLRPEIAIGKAWGVLAMGYGGRELARRAAKAPQFYQALNAMCGGRVVPVAGGVLIRNKKGIVIGSVGVSGDNSDNDEACAVFGIESVGLVADRG
ncbi:MAG: heme-binding protein [Deltaproteobacteria bacterium]|nr:heme-binding protein [Deltaproteobacteria bacterium]